MDAVGVGGTRGGGRVILGLDTSSAASSVALIDDTGDVVAMEREVDARRHAEVLAVLVDRVLSGRVPSLIAVGVGPGPYTGLRVGITTAQVLGHAWNVPVVGVCSLDVIARAAVHHGLDQEFVAASDARRREVYWARYDFAGERIDGPFVSRAAEVDGDVRALPWVGEGAHLFADDVAAWPVRTDLRYPDPAVLALLASEWVASGETAASAVVDLAKHGEDDGSTARQLHGSTLLAPYPLYVRRPDAAEPVTP